MPQASLRPDGVADQRNRGAFRKVRADPRQGVDGRFEPIVIAGVPDFLAQSQNVSAARGVIDDDGAIGKHQSGIRSGCRMDCPSSGLCFQFVAEVAHVAEVEVEFRM